ncbi:hypothetical protein MKW92_048900 [Papaver armeniacum]|nr:hypothetical protein MKW92_048900 [Papaver armeniacum]
MALISIDDVNTVIHGSTKAEYLSLDFIINYCDVKNNKSISEMPTNSNGRIATAADEPIYVAIGPYYYGIPRLELMNKNHKLRALRQFIIRGRRLPKASYLSSQKQGSYLEALIQALMNIVHQLRVFYEPLDKIWLDYNDFVILMLLDGVFLLEFLSINRGNQRNSDYDAADPIFGSKGHRLTYEEIKQDLLMPKNQLPYLVLSTLLSVSEGLPEMSVRSILSWMMFAPNIEDPGPHLLDMYLKGLLAGGQCPQEENLQQQQQQQQQKQQQQEDENEKISFFNLNRKLGVKCVRIQSVGNISFNKKTAILKLPTLYINKQNIREFVNLILYERQEGTNMDLNSYFHFLGLLIQSPKDIKYLRSQGIIVNSSSCDEAVMELIKEITKEAVQDRTCPSNLVLNLLNEYYQKWDTSKRSRYYGNLSAYLRKRILLKLSLSRQNYRRLKYMPVLFIK